MSYNRKWPTPFMKQCYVTAGVSMNMMIYGIMIGYNGVLFPQLRKDQSISIDEESESWIASILGISLIVSTLFAPPFMNKYGRRIVLIFGAVTLIIGWLIFLIPPSVPSLLIGKLLQGISMGFGSILGAILLGEYSSPKYRGSFIATIPTALLTGVLIVHLLGSVLTWRDIALISALLSAIALVMVIMSPESPSYLVIQGRYEDCRKVFHWLRGLDEDDELEKMIKFDMLHKEGTSNNKRTKNLFETIEEKVGYVKRAVKKKELYKPIFIMVHVHCINHFCGSLLSDTYTLDIFTAIFGSDENMYKIYATLDIQRIVSTIFGIFIIRRVKRRHMLLLMTGLNIIAYLLIALYIYAKKLNILPFDHLAIGISLLHLHFFSMAAGCIPLSNIIAGEIYPLEYRGLCGMICHLFFSVYIFIDLKSAPFLFSRIGVHGAYVLYAGLNLYSLVISMIMLPETKDKTLQDIEDEFRGNAIEYDGNDVMGTVKLREVMNTETI